MCRVPFYVWYHESDMKFSDLFKKAAPTISASGKVVGIDIGSSAMKVVELEDRNGVVTLTTYGELQLGPYQDNKAVGYATTLTAPLERQALVDILRESAVQAKMGVLSIPLSASFVTIMDIAAAKEEDLEPRVRVEARKYIPVPIADVTLDWAEVDIAQGNSEATPVRSVLTAAIQNTALARFSSLTQSVSMAKAPMEIECFSAIRGMSADQYPQVAFIDVGAASSKLYLVHKGLLQRMHRVPTAGQECTQRLAKELALSFEEAETIKRAVTSKQHEHYEGLKKVYASVFMRVFREFRQVIEEHEKRTGIAIDAVVLVGSATLLPGFDAMVGEVLNRPAYYIQPFDKVAYPAFMEDTLRRIGPSFGVALGAAMRAF